MLGRLFLCSQSHCSWLQTLTWGRKHSLKPAGLKNSFQYFKVKETNNFTSEIQTNIWWSFFRVQHYSPLKAQGITIFSISCFLHRTITILHCKPEAPLKWHMAFRNINLHFPRLNKSDYFLLLNRDRNAFLVCSVANWINITHGIYL